MRWLPVLWLYDPTALDQAQGKSEVGWEVFMRVRALGVRVAYIDLPHYGFLAPVPDDDPGNVRLKIRNLHALWPGFVADGAQCLIVFSSAEGEDAVSGIPGAVLTFARVEPGWSDLAEAAGDILASAGNWPGEPIAPV